MNKEDFFNSLRQTYPQPVIQEPIPGIGQPYEDFNVNPADYGMPVVDYADPVDNFGNPIIDYRGLVDDYGNPISNYGMPVADYAGEFNQDYHENPAEYGLPVADYGGEFLQDFHVNPADYGLPVADYGGEANPFSSWWPFGLPAGPESVGEGPVETETLVYGAISIVIIAMLGYLGRRFYNDYAAQYRIKKEINKRFRFGDREEKRQTEREQKENLVGGNGPNPLGPTDEEAKNSSEEGNKPEP